MFVNKGVSRLKLPLPTVIASVRGARRPLPGLPVFRAPSSSERRNVSKPERMGNRSRKPKSCFGTTRVPNVLGGLSVLHRAVPGTQTAAERPQVHREPHKVADLGGDESAGTS